jgi:putative tryptophan/tyrosine transport system substrate-binding protein
MITRREFIAGLTGAAAWPLAARAQQSAMPVVGLLDLFGLPTTNPALATFRQGLAAAGFIEGQTVAIEYRSANNQEARLAPLAAELVRRQVAVIVALDPRSISAAKAATSTIPIVFGAGGDPIKWGLVTNLSRPDRNMTGVTALGSELSGKQLSLLCDMAPSATTVAYLSDSRILLSEELTSDMLAAARALGRQLIILEARNKLDIEAAFATLVKQGAGALVVAPYDFFVSLRKEIIELAARHKIPTMYPLRVFAASGGLVSYNADPVPLLRQIGSLYVAQILRGAKPADLPVQQPTKFDLVINLKTAGALGLTVPPNLLAIADEVIE